MTVQNILDRGLARGRSIWPAFQHQLPGLLAIHVADRAVVFGVYSGAYLHGYNYLREITYETLAQMVLAYDQGMAELTGDEQRSIIDIAAKRYIEDQTLAAKDAALLNKERKVEQKAAEVDAKIEALEADRQTLATKITELAVAQAKANTTIKELEAKISEQALEGAQVEAEITRQQLIQQKADLDVIETGIRALEIQSQIADAAYRLAAVEVRKVELDSDIRRINLDTVEVGVRVSQTEAETARLKTQKGYESLTQSELTVAQAESTAYESETEILKQKGPLLTQRIGAADTEISVTIPKLEAAIRAEKDADLASQEARNQHAEAEHKLRDQNFDDKKTASDNAKINELADHLAEKTMIDAHKNDTANYYAVMTTKRKNYNLAVEAAAVKIAGAQIINTITHQIGTAAAK